MTQPEARGFVDLVDRDPRTAPRINSNMLGTQRDMDRMLECVRISRAIGRQAPFADVIDSEMTPGDYAARLMIARNDLLERRFERACCTYQCD